MNRCTLLASTVLGLLLTEGTAQAGWCLRTPTPEGQRLQKFWQDDSQAKGNGGASCPTCGSQRIGYAPVFVSPQMQWAVPKGVPGGFPQAVPPKPLPQKTGSPPAGARNTPPDGFELFLERKSEGPRSPGPRPPANSTSRPVVC
jgi:hypothetical protein